jgi:hypothetical protein
VKHKIKGKYPNLLAKITINVLSIGNFMKALKQKFTPRLIVIFTFILLITFGMIKPALAIENDDDGYIPADQVVDDDLLISAGNVIIDGTINGDAIVSGETVTINGNINGNLIVNGGLIEMNGTVKGSMASFGQKLIVNGLLDGSLYSTGVELILNPAARISRNILFMAFSTETLPGSSVGTDIHGTAYQAILAGSVGRNIFIDAMAIEVSGSVGGNAEFQVGDPSETPPNMVWLQFWLNGSQIGGMPEQLSPGLRVSTQAEIAGQLAYKSSAEQSETILAEPGDGVTFSKLTTTEPEHSQVGVWLLARLRELLSLLALGSLATWLIPDALRNSGHALHTKPLPSFGWGFLVLILGYTAIFATAFLLILLGILLAIVTLGGLAGAVFGIGFSGLFMIAGIFTLLAIYGSKIVCSFMIGEWIISRFSPENSGLRFLALVVGIAIYMIFRVIPIISVLVGMIATLFGLGAMLISFKKQNKEGLTAVVEEQIQDVA